jgi:23S rRNA (cytosine1962-C5)-methyltransferase
MSAVILKPDREKSLLRRHPWVFSGAVDRIEGNPGSGDTVDVISSVGLLLGRGAYSPSSQIRVRIWTFDPNETVSPEFFQSRIQRALHLRRSLGLLHPEGACRVVHGESDGLPGLIVDRYADYLVCQFLTAGTERWKSDILVSLTELLPSAGIYERSDVEARGREGLQPLAGHLLGREAPELLMIHEGPCRFAVDIRRGHKTGFYLDQRDNRALMATYARGAEVLNAFAYTGAFGIHALKAGAARVTHVESSHDALDLARHNLELNGLEAVAAEHIEGNVFQVLRQYRHTGRHFDLIVLDPPKFVEAQSHLERASRGYKDINLLAFRLLDPGGFLFTFSCSGLMPQPLFQKIVADAALDAGREAHILHRLGQSADHPTALAFPEGSYLKGLICRVV